MNTAERARQMRARIDSHWERRDEETEGLNGTGVTQASAKAAAAKTQAEWNERGKPTKSKPLEPWQRSTDDAVKRERGDSKEAAPAQPRREDRTDDRIKTFVRERDDGGVPNGFTAETWAEQVASLARRLARRGTL